MKRFCLIVLLLTSIAAQSATIRNDDSCDIATMPAATLLLPYFEVDFNSPASTARTTLFTVINTSNAPQIARVTLWTDWAFPALTFNLFLTGYDVQSINLYDVLGSRGAIFLQNPNVGSRSLQNDANPLFLPGAATACAQLPSVIPQSLLQDIRTALTIGTYSSCGTTKVGGVHTNAAGYLTIDVVATCGTTVPTTPDYYNELLYENVLGGDWEVIDPNPTTGNFAGGNPLVHIRAIPAGGPAGVVTPTNFPYTFYDRYTPQQDHDTARMDRRQPLPSAFAARYIQGGTGAFNTSFMIWREGVVHGSPFCRDYERNNGTAMEVIDEVRFDEHENPTTMSSGIHISAYQKTTIILPAASSTSTLSGAFPSTSVFGDVAGWMYLNLNTNARSRVSQNWMASALYAEGRYQTMWDATPLGNGCSPATGVTNATTIAIAPAP